ncbi:MAG: VWA domain-containing protein, partial [Lachnospiraceae bacterium]|nr:VWA domain-containing protein [Lachnospiraceae bacterium]
VTVDGLEASSYFIGRIDNQVKKIQRGTEPTFTFTEKKAYTYVIAGLVDDGLLRASGEADGEGNKRFNLSDENVNIEVIAPEGAFADDVAMEASDATAQSQDVEEELVGAPESNIVAAYEISFYNEDGAEQQPKNDVTVKIAADLDMSKEYTLIHIADNGEQSEVENAVFTEEGVEFVTDSFSVYAIKERGAVENSGSTITFNISGFGLKAAGSGIAANKTVTDTDGDGIYELALNVTGQSEQSTTTEAKKQNVVLVIDVSGSMNEIFDKQEYSYSPTTYNDHSAYYAQWANGDYVQVTHNALGWWTNTLVPIRVGGLLGGLFKNNTIYYGETRLDATKKAANAVVDALLRYNTNDDNITDMFEISVVKFANKNERNGGGNAADYNGTETIISKSTNANAIKNKINGLWAGGGTNWQAALTQAKNEADTKLNATNEKTSVIFLTDGFPTFYGLGNPDSGSGSEVDKNIATSYSNAREAARNIVNAGYTLYNIFAFGSDTQTHSFDDKNLTGYEYLCGLTNYAYGTGDANNWSKTTDEVKNYCFNAKNPQALIDTFTTIVAHITNNVGYAGVSFSDGVSLGATSTSVAVNGAAKTESMRYSVKDASKKTVFTMTVDKNGKATFVIPNGDGTNTTLVDDAPENVPVTIGSETKNYPVYSVTVGTGEAAKTYSMSPATIDANTGMVKWDLSGLGILENGYTYTVAFDVWPNQIAYDIAADLNNGIYASVDAALTDYGITDETKRQHIKDALHQEDDGSYSLYTNYKQEVEYYPATSTTDDDGNVSWSYGTKQTDNLKQPNPIPLQGSLLPLRKIWESGLAVEEYNELLWKDGIEGGTSKEYNIDLYVWKADTEDELETMVNSPVSASNRPYITAQLGWDATQNKYVWEKDVAVAPGTMVNLAEARKLGYNPNANPTKVRTFTPDGGTARQYYVVEDGHYYYVTEDGSDLHFELNTVLYHPMIVDGTLYNVGFGPNQAVERMDPMYAVVATNKLKGGLNITKVVSTTQIAVQNGEISNVTEPKDEDGVKTVTDEFTYEIKLWKLDDSNNKSAVYTYNEQIVNGAAIPGSIGYRIMSEPSLNADDGKIQYATTVSGAILTENSQNARLASGNFATIDNGETTITLTAPANGEIRIVNLPAGTKYSVKEVVDTTGAYTYAATESKLQEGTQVKDGTVTTANSVSGSIKGDTANLETFYNWAANFYVYHSSDNTIEKISFADPRVVGEYDADSGYTYSFNIVEETKNQHIYGGYYQAYAGAKMTDAEIKQATGYAEKTGNTAFTYAASRKGGLWLSDTGATAYVGDQTSWTKAKAYTEVPGDAMEPSADTVYYLKEVPKAYLEPATYVVYDERDADSAGYYQIKQLFAMTATDDANYKSVGFDITTSAGINDSGSHEADFWGAKVTVNKAGQATPYAELTAGDVVKDHTGLIAGKDVTKDPSYIVKNAYYREIPYYITLDNVKVTSLRRTIVNDRNTRWLNWTKPGMTKLTATISAAYATPAPLD